MKKILIVISSVFLIFSAVCVWFIDGFDNLLKFIITIISIVCATGVVFHYELEQQKVAINIKKLNINGNKNKINVENDITNEKQIIPLDNNKIM